MRAYMYRERERENQIYRGEGSQALKIHIYPHQASRSVCNQMEEPFSASTEDAESPPSPEVHIHRDSQFAIRNGLHIS